MINRLITISLKCLEVLGRLLPAGMMTRLGWFIGWIIAPFFPREREIARLQLMLALPKLPDGPLQSLHNGDAYEKCARRVFAHVGEAAAEFLVTNKITRSISSNASPCDHQNLPLITFDGDASVFEYIRNRHSLVALSAHVGCFEIIAAWYVKMGADVVVVGRDSHYPGLTNFIYQLRKKAGVETIWRNDKSSTKKMLSFFKGGKAIGVLVDQDIDLENGFSPFFGVEAAIPIGIIKLATKFKLPIFSSFIVREGHVRQRLLIREIPYDSADKNLYQTIMDRYHAHLEDTISRYPEQWIWWHRRWRRRPGVDYNLHPELLPSTKDYLAWIQTQIAKRDEGARLSESSKIARQA